jgi:uncharacterized OB-fold protein
MEAAIIRTDEEPAETKRHPWRCSWMTPGHGKCGQRNFARSTHCSKCGRPYAVEYREPIDTGKNLTEETTIAEAVAEYQEIAATVRNLFAQLHGLEERLGVLFVDQSGATDYVKTIDLHGVPGRYGAFRFENPDDVLAHAERQIWAELVERSGVLRVASTKRAEEIRKQLNDGDLPSLTPAHVAAWASETWSNIEEMHRERVREVFDWLRPHRDTHKTNSKFEIGKRVVLEWMIEKADKFGSWQPRVALYSYGSSSRRMMLRSLETVFRAFDGRGNVLPGNRSAIEEAIEVSDCEDPTGETEYFKFKACRNGNLHLEFKRPDLVAKLNALAGGKNLKT